LETENEVVATSLDGSLEEVAKAEAKEAEALLDSLKIPVSSLQFTIWESYIHGLGHIDYQHPRLMSPCLFYLFNDTTDVFQIAVAGFGNAREDWLILNL
jgi:hypothetical protein